MTPLSPALAFYVSHPAEVEELVALAERPPGVPAGDWEHFTSVHRYASSAVNALLDRALTAGLSALARHGKSARRTRKDNWNHWARFEPSGRPLVSGTLYVGVSVEFHPEQARACFVPYVAANGKTDELRALLASASADVATEKNVYDDHVPLALVPMTIDTDLDRLVDLAGIEFDAVARRWDTLL